MPALAQTPVAEQSVLESEMRANPRDVSLVLRYAQAAAAVRDYEAAIGALERVHFFNPRLSRLKYELGTLYFRLGSYAMAAQYFRQALEAPDLDPVTRARVESFLPDTEKQLQQSRWSGRLQVGTRYQTNPTFVPDGGVNLLFGFPTPVNRGRREDFNVFGMAQVGHVYDLQNGRGDTIETRVNGYATQQFNASAGNVALGDITTGPRIALAPAAWPGASIRPYATFGTAFLGGSKYMSGYGAGVTARLPVTAMLSVEPGIEIRRLDVTNSGAFFPTVGTLATGNLVKASLAATLRTTDWLSFEARALFRRLDGPSAVQSFDQTGVEAAARIYFDAPWSVVERWTVSPYLRVTQTEFGAPNPVVSPAITRRDTEWRTGLALEAPVTRNFGFGAVVEYSKSNSNLPNFTVSNFSVLLGPTYRF